MGQFKSMVKMFTDEPSVILKLKKGGNVKGAHKEMHIDGHGHKPMQHHAHAMHEAMEAEHGKSPGKPSMSERRKAMNPQLYKKGGNVAHKVMGGAMPMAAPAAAPMAVPAASTGVPIRPMARPAIAQMDPRQRAARAMMVRRALMGMKKGGSADKVAALEKELHHHEALSASKAHGKASGGAIDRAETRTTIEKGAKKFDKTKMDTAHKDRAHGTGEIKEGKPGGFKRGGTIEGNEGKFANTKVDTAKHDKAHGTGDVKEGKPGGFNRGGGVGRAIEGNESKFAVNNVNTGDKYDSAHGTKGVRESNAGGYRKGGAAKKAYATGGNVVNDGKAEKMPHHFVSRPVANSLQSGTFKKGGKVEKEEKPNLRLLKTHTGPKGHVAKVYKDRDWDEHRVKFFSPEGKHLSAADYHTPDASDAHETAMHEVEKGFQKGGEVGKPQVNDLPEYDPVIASETRRMKNEQEEEKKSNEAMRESILGAPRRAYDAFKDFFSTQTPPSGSVTKTKESTTVVPQRKRGGKC